MPFPEVDIFGIYVAPIAILMLVAWLLLVLIRRIADRLNVFAFEIWHPALFNAALYLILLSSLVLALAGRGSS
jgi:protein AaeX